MHIACEWSSVTAKPHHGLPCKMCHVKVASYHDFKSLYNAITCQTNHEIHIWSLQTFHRISVVFEKVFCNHVKTSGRRRRRSRQPTAIGNPPFVKIVVVVSCVGPKIVICHDKNNRSLNRNTLHVWLSSCIVHTSIHTSLLATIVEPGICTFQYVHKVYHTNTLGENKPTLQTH